VPESSTLRRPAAGRASHFDAAERRDREPTDRSPDLTLDVSALGAAYLGWSRLRDAVLPRGVDEHRPGALDEATALFATLEVPWCSTFF
jgi:hypothetical protein